MDKPKIRTFVVLDYTCEQNEPSMPRPKLLRVRDPKELKAWALKELTRIIKEDVGDEDAADEENFEFTSKKWPEYCDFAATFDEEIFLLFTEVS